MATLTGLEPATSAVTGRRANQLRYRALLVVLHY
jgi:integrase